MARYLRASSIGLALPYGLLASSIAFAQGQPEDEAGTAIVTEAGGGPAGNEIIVTAQKREESAQDVPMTIAVFGGEELVNRQIDDVADLGALSPNVTVGEVNGLAKISIRGIGLDNFSNGADPSVALHVDGFVVSQPGAQLGSFFDLERVEVLKGPQGTLYGRNSTGGTINLITRQPTDHFEGYVRGTYGNYDALILEAAVGGSIVPGLLNGRIAFKSEDRDGFGINEQTGKGIDDANRWAGRASLELTPADELSATLVAERFRQDDSNYFHKFRAVSFPDGPEAMKPRGVLLGGTLPQEPRNINSDLDARSERTSEAYYGTLSWDVSEALVLRSLTGWRNYHSLSTNDLDYTDVPFAGNVFVTDSSQFSQELQLLVDWGKLSGVIGAYHFRERLEGDNRVGPDPFGARNGLILAFAGTVKTEAQALFANLAYQFTPELSLVLGGRYSYEKRTGVNMNVLGGVTREFRTGGSDTDFSPRLGINFEPSPDTLLYASYSKGFKSGVVIAGGTTPMLRPEKIDAYEVGFKSVLLRDTLIFNVAAFHYDIQDLQVGRTLPGSSPGSVVSIFENAGGSQNRGIDMEAVWRPVDAFTLSLNAGYLDARFTEYSSINPLDAPELPLRDLAGNRTTQAPEWSGTLRAEHVFEIEPGSVTFAAEAVYSSRIFFTAFNEERLDQDAVTRINANARFDARNSPVFANLFVQNLTNELIAMSGTPSNFGRVINVMWAPPRIYGITLGYDF